MTVKVNEFNFKTVVLNINESWSMKYSSKTGKVEILFMLEPNEIVYPEFTVEDLLDFAKAVEKIEDE